MHDLNEDPTVAPFGWAMPSATIERLAQRDGLPVAGAALLRRRTELERVAASIATRFIRVEAGKVDNEINDTLRAVGELTEVDRAYLYQIAGDGLTMDNTHEWCARGVAPLLPHLQGIATGVMPWSMHQLAQGQAIYARCPADLPAEALAERELFTHMGTRSFAVIPLLSGERLLGLIGLDTIGRKRNWDEQDIALLKLISEVFVLALERVRSEAALRQRERELTWLVEHSPDIVLRLDRQLRCQYLNQAGARCAGNSLTEFIGKTPSELGFGLDSTIFAQIAQAGELFTFEGVVYGERGQARHLQWRIVPEVDDGGHILSLLAVGRDVTDLKDVQVQLKQLNYELEVRVAQRTSELAVANAELQRVSQLQEAILNSANYIIVSTDADGVVQTFNAGAERLLGYTAQDVIGRVTPEVFHDPDELAERQRVMQAATGMAVNSPFEVLVAAARGDVADEREYTLVRRDGSRFPCLLSLTALRDASGAVGFLGIGSDITMRKQVEEVLRASEEQYRTLVDNSLQGILIYQNARIVFANEAMTDIAGYSVEELLNLSAGEVMRQVHKEDRSLIFPSETYANAGLETRRLLQFRLLHKDGTIRWVMSTAMQVTYHGQPARQAVLLDITELKRAEASLLESKRFVEKITETSPTFIFVYDLDQRRNIYSNPAAQALLGHDSAGLDALSSGFMAEIVHPDDVPAVLERVAHYGELQDNEYFEQELRVRGATGDWHWLLLRESVFRRQPDGQPVQILGVSMDVTALKRSERALQESEERFRLIAENSTDLICLYEPDGTIVYASPSAKRLMGFEPRDLVGQRATGLLHPDDVDELIERAYRPLLDGRSSSARIEHRLRHMAGDYLWVDTNMNAIAGEQGAVYRLIATSRDITERKRTELALRNALTKERELNELKSRFVSMASHEFRTPLATILAATETLLAYRQKMDQRQTDLRLQRIRNQVQHLSQILDEILSMTHVQGGRMELKTEVTDLNDFCRAIIEEFQSRSDISHTLDYQHQLGPLPAAVDRKLMRTVIANLLSNAIKYSPTGSRVHIETRRAGDTIEIEVVDQGIGIPESDQKHLFETFYRASNVGPTAGTGLGLAIAKEFVDLHGGQITFASELSAGTSFLVMLPAAE